MKISEALRNIRKSKGYSQEQVADFIGIDTTNYGRIERGQTSINLDRLERLALLYKINLIELVSIISNIEISSQQEKPDLKPYLDSIEFLKQEVLFLRELLLNKDNQINSLLNNQKKLNTNK